MKTLGVVVGLVLLVAAGVLAIAAVLSLSNQTSWTDLEVGECFDLAGAVEEADGDLAAVFSVDTLDCDDPHDAQVVAAGALNPDGDRPYPSDDELFAEIDRECGALVPETVDPSTYGIVPIAPDERTWSDRDGRFVCVSVVIGGGTVTGSPLD
jgi:hypothetical protein